MSKNHRQKKVHESLKKFAHKKWLIIGLVILFIIIVVITVCCILFKPDSTPIQTKNQTSTTKTTVQKTVEITNKLDTTVADSGAKAGQVYLDAELKKTDNSQEQAHIYLLKATLVGSLMGGDDKKTALEYAYKAEALYQNTESALSIAFYEEGLNNIPNAIKFYQIYLDRIPKGADGKASSDSDYDYYSTHLHNLEASVK